MKKTRSRKSRDTVPLRKEFTNNLTLDLEQRSCTEGLRAPEQLLACILKITKIQVYKDLKIYLLRGKQNADPPGKMPYDSMEVPRLDRLNLDVNHYTVCFCRHNFYL